MVRSQVLPFRPREHPSVGAGLSWTEAVLRLCLLVCLAAGASASSARDNPCLNLADLYAKRQGDLRAHELRALAACVDVSIADRSGSTPPLNPRTRRSPIEPTGLPPVQITHEQKNVVSVGPAFDPNARLEYLCLEPRDMFGFDASGTRITVKVHKSPRKGRY